MQARPPSRGATRRLRAAGRALTLEPFVRAERAGAAAQACGEGGMEAEEAGGEGGMEAEEAGGLQEGAALKRGLKGAQEGAAGELMRLYAALVSLAGMQLSVRPARPRARAVPARARGRRGAGRGGQVQEVLGRAALPSHGEANPAPAGLLGIACGTVAGARPAPPAPASVRDAAGPAPRRVAPRAVEAERRGGCGAQGRAGRRWRATGRRAQQRCAPSRSGPACAWWFPR
jgi:hypothetical protein